MWRLFKAHHLLTAAATATATALTNRSLANSLLGHFMCQSAACGGCCNVYLIGIAHGTEDPREEVKALIESVKPEVVFTELCPSRDDFMANPALAHGEFYVANTEAMKLGAKITFTRFWEGFISHFTLSYVNFTHMIKKKCIEKDDVGASSIACDELERMFLPETETLINERDQYMSATLLEVARQHKSLLLLGLTTYEEFKSIGNNPLM